MSEMRNCATGVALCAYGLMIELMSVSTLELG
jgi:hypothetical protein